MAHRFHHNSFLVSRSIHTVRSLNASLTFNWIEAIFANQVSEFKVVPSPFSCVQEFLSFHSCILNCSFSHSLFWHPNFVSVFCLSHCVCLSEPPHGHVVVLQENYSNEATWKQTPEEVVQSLAALAQQELSISEDAFLQAYYIADTDISTRSSFKASGYALDSKPCRYSLYDMESFHWKRFIDAHVLKLFLHAHCPTPPLQFGCSRGIVGTPTFTVNGVQVDADSGWSIYDWRELLDPLIPPRSRTLKGHGGLHSQ